MSDRKYKFNELFKYQHALMTLTRTKSIVTDVPVGDLIIWLLAEAGEALNEAKFFKYCRPYKVDKDKLLEELTDCLFMYLEISLHCDFGNVKTDLSPLEINKITNETELKNEFTNFIYAIAKAYRRFALKDKDFANYLRDSVASFCSILEYYEFSNDDMIDMYHQKFETNVKRLFPLK